MVKSFINRMISIPARIRASRNEQESAADTNPYLMKAMRNNKRQGQVLAIQARWAALAIISILLVFLSPNWSVLYYQALLLAFALLGWAQLRAAKVGQSRLELFLIVLDLVLLTVIALLPNPLTDQGWPNAMQYRFDNFSYFYIILAGATLAYSWRTLFAIGTWTFGLWMIGLVLVIIFGRTDSQLSNEIANAVNDSSIFFFLDPNNPMISSRIQEVVVFLIVTGILALNGWRSNQLLLKQASAMRERENLARYFPPSIVNELADENQPFANIRSQPVAVLFADIVGFTRLAEQGNPEKVVALLREYHKRLEAAVFENSGTLDKFLGDGIMATFGSPRVGPHDASNAMQCARDMVDTVDSWNSDRQQRGEQSIKLSIGIHYGDVILGDIGSERRLEFATLGDTVNVAARLEELTRTMGTQVIVSNELVEANRDCKAENDNHLLDSYTHAGKKMLRGRDSEIDIWKLDAS